MTFSTSPTSSGSSADVTSSRSITLGRMASARAKATRCCWPPESWLGIVVQLVAEPDHGEQLARPLLRFPLRQLQHRARRLHAVLQRRHVREQVEVLEHHADLAADAAEMPRVGRHQPAVLLDMRQRLAVDPDDAAVDRLQRHQHAQHGRLARARRADDRDLLARRHIESRARRARSARRSSWSPCRSGPSARRPALQSLVHDDPPRRNSQPSNWRIRAAVTRLKTRKNRPTSVIGSV